MTLLKLTFKVNKICLSYPQNTLIMINCINFGILNLFLVVLLEESDVMFTSKHVKVNITFYFFSHFVGYQLGFMSYMIKGFINPRNMILTEGEPLFQILIVNPYINYYHSFLFASHVHSFWKYGCSLYLSPIISCLWRNI